MALWQVKVGKPTRIAKTPPFLTSFINPKACFSRLVVIGNLKFHISRMIAQPNKIVSNQRKDFNIVNCILIPYNQKLLPKPY